MPAAARESEMARFRVNPIPPGDLLENSFPTPEMGPPPPPPVPVGGTPAGATPGETLENPSNTTPPPPQGR
jgi:adhesin transport system outer membrane protein